ncbi:MAG: flagellar type III secretion system pore protein FliP [Fimbriimonadaceae bacterium]|nr:flagellar type III secretion system pore protein FliP [Fimbriimonadaceae bacterium]QYK57129.1 MAG: flagellar type III secretion system pore protein FliP [Fimbriimonadaceae bacterium]
MKREFRGPLLRILLLLAVLGLGTIAYTQSNSITPVINIGIAGDEQRSQISTGLQILVLLTVLSLAPAILMLTTAFTRIVVILSFMRTALGTASIPPNQVIVGLSLFLTFFVMEPVYSSVYNEAYVPYTRDKDPIPLEEAVALAERPVRAFMLKHTYEADLKTLLEIRQERPKNGDDVALLTLVPAFVISELKTGFVVGLYILIPFVIIDIIVASILMGMGMMMMPPTVISLPAKILIFTMADGWSLLVNSIVMGYR